MKILNIMLTAFFAIVSSAIASDVLESRFNPEIIDALRLGFALVVGGVVNALTMLASGRGFQRLDRMKSKSRATIINISEVLVSGAASAALVGVVRGFLRLELPISAEFALAAIAGSIGAERMFAKLEKSTIDRVLKSKPSAGDAHDG